MRSRVPLQPTLRLEADETQEPRFARRVGHGKTGEVFINVYENTNSTGNITFTIETASHTAVSTQRAGGTGDTFWSSAGSGTMGPGSLGVVQFAISGLGEWVRWDVANIESGKHVDFDVVVYLSDA